ncbi:hypothetical protein GCM10025865_11100 [Paraoerskovia sediminicola]|uniref:ABC transporter domain-containing protein n=1 Tax=Paraoerskovia sediminicola TaxID=1138587 RepID=A0ABM8G1A8_9CELL|nr:hypothetical protein GCM10025865_11100 [Paraoerskovia sediminicola]
MKRSPVPDDAALAQFVEDMGLYMEGVGFSRAGGRVLGWLQVCDPPEQSAQQIVEGLHASTGSVSTNLGVLVRAGFVEKVTRAGDRKTYYRIGPDAWDVVMTSEISTVRSLDALTRAGLDAIGDPTSPGPAGWSRPAASSSSSHERSPRSWSATTARRAPPMSDVAIRTHGLSKDFGDFTAVDAIDLEVATGEIFGFLGPNGAGKSTTIRVLLDQLRPTAGTATILGRDVRADSSRSAGASGTSPATSRSTPR